MKIFILSLFPEKSRLFFLKGIFQKAHSKKLFDISFIDIRDFSHDKHNRVDDYPFGYKKGMILKADVLYRAITSIDQFDSFRLLYTCPKGPIFNQELATSYLKTKGLIVIPGYYEGIDERIFELLDIERVSIGNVVLSSGELPALTIAEAVLRQISGVIGKDDCLKEDSFLSGLLEGPQYTHPREFLGQYVPDVIVSGNHAKLNAWRRERMIEETLLRKPDLLAKAKLSAKDQNLVVKIIKGKT